MILCLSFILSTWQYLQSLLFFQGKNIHECVVNNSNCYELNTIYYLILLTESFTYLIAFFAL